MGLLGGACWELKVEEIFWGRWDQCIKKNRVSSRYYNYILSINGKAERHADVYASDYLTDVIASRAHSFLDLYGDRNIETPFLMVLAPPAAHAPFTPAPQHAAAFPNATAPRTPAFNNLSADPAHAKHWMVQQQPEALNEAMVEEVDEMYR